MFLDAQHLKVTYQPIIEVRERLERRIDRDFTDSARDNRTDLFGRYRLGFSAKYGQWKGTFVAQWADDEAWVPTSTTMTERRDVILAFLQHPLANGDLIIGRQRLRKGNERLLAESNWNNVSNAFDGVRWLGKTVDVFATKVGVTANPTHDAKVAGASYSTKTSETLYVFRHDDQDGTIDDTHTLSELVKVRRGPVALDVEAAGQLGHRGSRDVEAWAVNSLLNYKTTSNVTLFATGNVASGGGPKGTYRTFDSLYSTGHGIYGFSDLQGWRNTQNLGVGVRYKARKDIEIVGDYFRYGLRDARDGWYSNGGINRRPGGRFIDPTGNSGRDVGSEFAMEVRWDARKDLTVHAGLGIFQAGHFIESLTTNTNDHTFGYVQAAYRF